MLSRRLADQAHYPAIDLNGSISRVMQTLVNSDELKQSNKLRRLWSVYQQNADLVQVGAYESGSNPELDEAIRIREQMVDFLRQDMDKGEDYAMTRSRLSQMLS
jgi:flagellum-specific ATP synthase